MEQTKKHLALNSRLFRLNLKATSRILNKIRDRGNINKIGDRGNRSLVTQVPGDTC